MQYDSSRMMVRASGLKLEPEFKAQPLAIVD